MRSFQTGNGRTGNVLHPIIRRIRRPLVTQVEAPLAATPPASPDKPAARPEAPPPKHQAKLEGRKEANATAATSER